MEHHYKTAKYPGNDWYRRGKKYHTRAMDALSQLYGESPHDKDCQSEEKKPHTD